MQRTSARGALSPTIGPTDPYAEANVYYGGQTDSSIGRSVHRTRTLSSVSHPSLSSLTEQAGLAADYQQANAVRANAEKGRLRRRASHGVDVTGALPRKFVIDVEETLTALLSSEDTDDNKQITIEDAGPKILRLGTARSNGIRKFGISGTYMLSNLLQELTLAKDYGRERIILDEARLNENPVARLTRLIRKSFWDRLTRRIDAAGLEIIAADPKNRTKNQQPRIYIPYGEQEQYDYYQRTARERPHLNLMVEWLPEKITPEWVKSVNDKPGLLALAMERVQDSTGRITLRGYPFVVPGGRFNEMYGWDSYFETLGLLVDGKVDLARAMVENFIYEIKHYGKILNANRSYYLCRSQPPFLTDMALQVYEKIKHEPDALDFIRRAIIAAIKEYRTVWTLRDGPRRDPITGLTRYRPDGLGIPPETEASHFHHILEPFCKKHGMTFEEFQVAYNDNKVHEPELDIYFMHDRAVRESGHDTTYRFDGVCADLATVDLNVLLYKYETDISATIRKLFNDSLLIPGQREPETSSAWDRRAQRRRKLVDKYLWNDEKGMYFDYNCLKKEPTTYESATTFWALWAGIATPLQAAKMVERALPKFTFVGGLVAGTEASCGDVSLDAPNRQWDYPTGWAPHQMLAWYGLRRYGYVDEAQNLAYRWLYTILKSFVDFNGVVVEKYNVTHNNPAHRVDAEYGNQGSDFEGVAREGFGWVNASFQVGISEFCDVAMKRALGTCSPPHVFFARRAEFELDPDGTASPDYVVDY